MLLNILQSTEQTPTTKNYPVQRVSSAKIEKPGMRHPSGKVKKAVRYTSLAFKAEVWAGDTHL